MGSVLTAGVLASSTTWKRCLICTTSCTTARHHERFGKKVTACRAAVNALLLHHVCNLAKWGDQCTPSAVLQIGVSNDTTDHTHDVILFALEVLSHNDTDDRTHDAIMFALEVLSLSDTDDHTHDAILFAQSTESPAQNYVTLEG
jgi:hypothetical protein